MNFDDFRIAAGAKADLGNRNPQDTGEVTDKDAGKAILKANRKDIIRLQEQLYAENQQSLLVVFQAMDTGGKDGCIENVFKGVNPSGVHVHSFKAPTEVELGHDFLWRVHQHTPLTGHISVFNRSHYEDVLVVRVKNLVPPRIWRKRYDQINAFEEILQDRGTRIVKFYLHISKDEQKERLAARLEDPDKHWKFSRADLVEREHWNEYQQAFEDAISKTSTEGAPWYVIPANKKWYRDAVVSGIVLKTLRDMNPQYPVSDDDLSDVIVPD